MSDRECTLERMNRFFNKKEIERICFTHDNRIRIDLHGLKRFAAREFINDIIYLLRGPHILEVIHGYHGGVSLMTMVRCGLNNEQIYEIIPDEKNLGITYLKVY